MNQFGISATFVGPAGRRLFVLLHEPVGRVRDCVMLIPPFAEEMNKSRKMFTIVAQGLAARGVLVALPDLFGTGDSDGEFAEGTWSRWQQDLTDVRAFLGTRGYNVTGLLALRTGCVLAADVAKRNKWALTKSVFWQPVVDGARFLTQFLRLRIAASLMESDRRETVSALRARLRAGETLEVAGYGLSPGLADGIEAASLGASLDGELGPLHWIEIVRGEDRVADPSRGLIEAARRQQLQVDASTVQGEPFWAATEIVTIPALVERTVAILA